MIDLTAVFLGFISGLPSRSPKVTALLGLGAFLLLFAFYAALSKNQQLSIPAFAIIRLAYSIAIGSCGGWFLRRAIGKKR